MQLTSVKKESQSNTEFCTKIKNLAGELQIAGKPISDEDLCSYVLTGLDNTYEFVVVLLTSKLHELTFDEIYSVQLNHEAKIEQNSSQE